MRTMLGIALTLSTSLVAAAPPEVTGVRWDSKTDLAWDPVAGALGYHVYQGDVANLPDDATCLVGSNQSESIGSNQTVASGQVLYYLVAGYDETGQSGVGTDSLGANRMTADQCKPARRFFAPARDGDQGDGVIDGDEPLQNPSLLTQATRRGETVGVILHSGEFFYTAENLRIPGRHLDWGFRRTYRSQVNYDGPLGHNWEFDLNARLTPLGSDVRFYNGAGHEDIFGRVSSTRFDSPRGRYGMLIENPDGSFSMRSPHGTIRNFHPFDGSNVQGALESIEHRKGDRISLLYDHQGLLTTAVDSLGRSVDFAYDDAGRMTSVTDFDGRSWVYGYDAAGDLVTARSPVVTGTPNGNDFPAGKTTTYSYTGGSADPRLNHCMETIVNPNEETSGTPWIQNVYFDGTAPAFDVGRVDTWTVGGTNASGIPAGGTIDLSYESLNSGQPPDPVTPRRRTTIIDRNGNQRRYVHNYYGHRIEETHFTNREIRPGEPDYTTTHSYNSDGELVQSVYPEGNRLELTYDTPGADRYREGNLLEVRRVADSLSGGGRGDGHGGETNDLVATYEYEPIYNLVTRNTDARGNDASYVPQNGGLQSADRYSSEMTYCHQEGDPATNGLNDYASRFGIDTTGFVSGLGDVNGDAVTDRIFGTPIRTVLPEVTLDSGSNQAGIEGDTSQDSIILHLYNSFAQRTQTKDAEGNVHLYTYHPENDPDGDGTQTPTPADGRTLDPSDGGYLATARFDTASGASRNNGTNPPPADVRSDYSYDAVGNVTGVVDGRGVLTRYVRNQLNQVVQLRRAAATADASGPDGDPATGRGETGLTPFSFKIEYSYDANNNVTDIAREDRNQDHGADTTANLCVIWDIKDGGVAVETEDQTGSTLRTDFRYDPNRNLTQVIHPEGNTDEFAFDERDFMFRATKGATGPRGGTPSTRSYDYDANGNLVAITDARGNPIDRELDGHDRMTRVVDQVGNTVEHFYDPTSQVVRTLHRGPVGGPTPLDRLGTTNVDLRDVALLWDEQQRLFRVDQGLFIPSGAAPGRPPVINEGPSIPADGAINTTFEYDRLGRRTFVVRDTNATTRTDFDGLGRTVETILPDGSSVEWTWDDQHNMIESAETELSSSPGPGAALFLTTNFFDALGRLEQSVDNIGLTTRYVYSSLDAVIRASDGNGPSGPTINRRSAAGSGLSIGTNLHGNVTRYDWDAAGRLLRSDRILTATGLGDGTPDPSPTSTDPNNLDGLNSVIYSWDDNSLKLSSQDDKGNTTSHAYDNLNRMLSYTNDDATISSYVYDPEHNVTQHTDPNGNVMTYTYDDANRSTQLSISRATGIEGTTLQTFEYDGENRLTRATDDNDPLDTGDDADVRTVYDSLSRVVEEKQIYGSLPTAEKLVDYRWEADSLITDLIYPSGRQITYAYDAADRLASVGDTTRAESASFDWFGTGRLHTRSYGNGTRMTMLNDAGTVDEGYDGVRRIVKMRHLNSTNAVLAGFEHSYDRASNRLHELRLHDEDVAAGGFVGELWAFDSANRLTSFEEGVLDAGLNIIGSPSDAQSWAFDGVGNWVQMTRNGTTFNFTPNNLNEYDEPQSGGTRTDDGLPDDAYDDAGTPTADGENRAHDKNGNRTDDSRLQYFFDFRNRLVRVMDAGTGAPIAEYDYDAFGRRVFRNVTNSGPLNETRRYLYTPLFPVSPFSTPLSVGGDGEDIGGKPKPKPKPKPTGTVQTEILSMDMSGT